MQMLDSGISICWTVFITSGASGKFYFVLLFKLSPFPTVFLPFSMCVNFWPPKLVLFLGAKCIIFCCARALSALLSLIPPFRVALSGPARSPYQSLAVWSLEHLALAKMFLHCWPDWRDLGIHIPGSPTSGEVASWSLTLSPVMSLSLPSKSTSISVTITRSCCLLYVFCHCICQAVISNVRVHYTPIENKLKRNIIVTWNQIIKSSTAIRNQ